MIWHSIFLRGAKLLGRSIDLWNVFHGARILVAPLDWGLGHAARCIPIIKGLIDLDAHPIIGADNAPMALLRKEFPQLEHVRLPGHRVRYSTGNSQVRPLLFQFPGMVRSIAQEHARTMKICRDLSINGIISDQRFGVRSSELPSVLITHQLFPKAPALQGLLQRIGRGYVEKFDRCWVMDEEDAPGLAGELSHGAPLPKNARYIGTQSRFSSRAAPNAGTYRVVAVLSGPEPQRSILEGILLQQLEQIEGDHLIVQGLPDEHVSVQRGNITMVPDMPSQELQGVLQHARLIVSRSGYTTLMDLTALGRSALLVPTPGQPEQEYLGTLHSHSSRFMVQAQSRLDLRLALSYQEHRVQQSGSRPFCLEEAFAEYATLLGKASVPLPSTQ